MFIIPAAPSLMCMIGSSALRVFVTANGNATRSADRSDMIRVTNRCPSAIRSTSIDIASIACSMRSSRAAVSGWLRGAVHSPIPAPTTPRTSGIPIDMMIAVTKNAIGTTISSSHTVRPSVGGAGERAFGSDRIGAPGEQLRRETLSFGDSFDFDGDGIDRLLHRSSRAPTSLGSDAGEPPRTPPLDASRDRARDRDADAVMRDHCEEHDRNQLTGNPH